MNTWHIHIEGRVQGVGFRPMVYRVAKKLNLNGTIASAKNGVHIYVNATKKEIDEFISNVKLNAPKAAEMLVVNKIKVSLRNFEDFSIIASENGQRAKLLLTPDLALCDDCRNELNDPRNKRHNYAFTTCAHCGPRYSILKSLPFDRDHTTMADFKMCPQCNKEYNTVDDSRFYSQTNSCPTCGITQTWLSSNFGNGNKVDQVVSLLKKGKIAAIKSIGGFLLLVDATNEATVNMLRKWKMRPTKPFALIFPNIEVLSTYARISHVEHKALESLHGQIVLLRLQINCPKLAIQAISPGLNRIGAMLPYTPILELISTKFGKPLVATSANVSGSPIIYEDSEALRILPEIADAILSNDRAITFPQDDSVVQFSAEHRQKIITRRARGRAPSIAWPANRLPDDVLAFGAEPKSAFALTSVGNTYLSQYLGDTSMYENQVRYNDVLDKLRALLNPQTTRVVVDAHPDYHTARMGSQWASYHGLLVEKVYHHHAHFAAILVEHNLLSQKEPVLGVVWDGTGYGMDGMLWGSEFFVYENKKVKRTHHVKPYPHLFNDRMALEPKLSAIAALWPVNPGKVWMRHHFTEQEQLDLENALQTQNLFTTSMGRLFDAAAAILNVASKNTYDGESAFALQVLAENSKLRNWEPFCLPVEGNMLDASSLLEILMAELKAGGKAADLAMRFHQTVVQWIAWVADTSQIENVAFSGGVFQNSLLVDLIVDRMKSSHNLYFHNLMPPNDENIAIGQIAMTTIEVLPEDELKNVTSYSHRVCV